MSQEFKTLINDHREKWGIHDNLLQSYRGIFISSQSFLLAVGAILSSNGTNILYLDLLALTSILLIWIIWFPVVRARHLTVDYHKYLYKYYMNEKIDDAKKEKIKDKILSENKYKDVGVCNWKLRKPTNKKLKIPSNFRTTRVKMDLVLPIVFSLLWIFLILSIYFPDPLNKYFT